MTSAPSPDIIEALRAYDTPTLANAVESLGIRLRNEGFTDASVRCVVRQPKPLVGRAVTVRIRCSNPPKAGHAYTDRTDWWKVVSELPRPLIAVIEDVDDHPGTGSFIGGVHAAILQALGCAGVITNGAVRDIPALEELGMHAFAGSVSVSHAYAHIVEFGRPVQIGGLEIKGGDLLHADRHGILSIPESSAHRLPEIAERIIAADNAVMGVCRSRDFSIEKLRQAIGSTLP